MLTKEEIKKWMKENGKDRYWLAEECDTGKRAVDKWFEAKNKLPAKAILVLMEHMGKTKKEELEMLDNYDYVIELRFPGDKMKYLKESARNNNQTVAERCVYLMQEDIKEYEKSREDDSSDEKLK